MRVLASILLALFFVSFSALASYETADHKGTAVGLAQHAADTLTIPTDAPVANHKNSDGKDDCPCEAKSGSLTLTCGVTLALSDDMSGYLPDVKQAWFAYGHTDRNDRLMYLLRRPPRYVL